MKTNTLKLQVENRSDWDSAPVAFLFDIEKCKPIILDALTALTFSSVFNSIEVDFPLENAFLNDEDKFIFLEDVCETDYQNALMSISIIGEYVNIQLKWDAKYTNDYLRVVAHVPKVNFEHDDLSNLTDELAEHRQINATRNMELNQIADLLLNEMEAHDVENFRTLQFGIEGEDTRKLELICQYVDGKTTIEALVEERSKAELAQNELNTLKDAVQQRIRNAFIDGADWRDLNMDAMQMALDKAAYMYSIASPTDTTEACSSGYMPH